MNSQNIIDDDDSEIPRIDISDDFGPENPNVQVDPMFAALSLGMQQMPGGIEGMKYNIKHFMNATDRRYWNRNIDTYAIERMMFDPDERTIERLISLMETRYDEVHEMEQRLLNEHLEKIKKFYEKEMERRESELAEQLRQKRIEEEGEDNVQDNIQEDSDNDSESNSDNDSESKPILDCDQPIIEEVSEDSQY